MEDMIWLCTAIMFSAFHSRFGIFYLNLPVFWWEKEGLLFFIYRTEKQVCDPGHNPVSSISWNWNPEPPKDLQNPKSAIR